VTVAELMPEKFRARLSCRCEVGGKVVLDGELKHTLVIH
jgi:hypothetical protein